MRLGGLPCLLVGGASRCLRLLHGCHRALLRLACRRSRHIDDVCMCKGGGVHARSGGSTLIQQFVVATPSMHGTGLSPPARAVYCCSRACAV
jgi:hypothetical protein